MPQHELENRLIDMSDRFSPEDLDAFETPDAWELSDFEDLLPTYS